MEKHSSIIQAEAIAVVVGLILVALAITIVILLVIIYVTKQKMKEKSQFTIHVARNFKDSFRDKETPVSDYDRHSLNNRPFDEPEPLTESLDNPLYQHTTSFTGATNEVATAGITNPRNEQDTSAGSAVSIPSVKEVTDSGSVSKLTENDYQVPLPASPAKPPVALPPVALPRGTTKLASPRRPPPMLTIIKPKPYNGSSANKPAVPGKPAIATKPSKQPVLPPAGKPPVEIKPSVKPKPKALPRNI